MKLKKYLIKNRIQRQEFARMLNVCPASITFYTERKRTPSIKVALRIEKLTKGFVTLYDWK